MRLFPNPKRIKHQLPNNFKGKRVLDLNHHARAKPAEPCCGESALAKHDLTRFPWPIPDDTYDLIICQHVLEHLPNTAQTLEEMSRITAPSGKIFVETVHYNRMEAFHPSPVGGHRFTLNSFDDYIKGSPHCRTEFHIEKKYLFFDDLTYMLGIGYLANLFPRQYEKSLSFLFPAKSFYVTFVVDK